MRRVILRTMKRLRHIITIVCIVAGPIAHAAEQPTANDKGAAKHPGTALTPAYETAAQIKGMPRCKATVDERSPCSVRLSSPNGKRFSIGSPGATKEVAAFLSTLKYGHTYTFPDDFLDFQKTHK